LPDKKNKRRKVKRKKRQPLGTVEDAVDAFTETSRFSKIIPDLENKGWGKDVLTRLLEAAFYNVGVTFLKLKPYLELQTKALEIFFDAGNALSWSTVDGFVCCSLLTRAASCHFAAVMLSCAGQITETWVMLRACLENSLYAFYVARNPKLAEIWMNRHDNETSKDACKRQFMIGNMWKDLAKESRRIAKEAKALYETSIDCGGHPNERSVTPNVVQKKDRSGYHVKILNPGEALTRMSLIMTLMTCSCVFEIFSLIFQDQFDQPNLKMKISYLKEQIKPLAIVSAGRLRTLR